MKPKPKKERKTQKQPTKLKATFFASRSNRNKRISTKCPKRTVKPNTSPQNSNSMRPRKSSRSANFCTTQRMAPIWVVHPKVGVSCYRNFTSNFNLDLRVPMRKKNIMPICFSNFFNLGQKFKKYKKQIFDSLET